MEQLPPIHNWGFQMAPPPPTSWMDEFLDFSATRRSSHRRTVSDPISFVEDSNNSLQFDRLDDEQLHNMFSDDKKIAPKAEPAEEDDTFNEPAPDNPVPPRSPENPPADAIADPKRIKRILANRQSAQRSRVRKLQYISELERSVTTLQTEVSALSPRVAFMDHQRLILNVDNSALKQRIAALAQDKIFKDAHQEALKKEIERLRKTFQEQKMKKSKSGDEAVEENNE